MKKQLLFLAILFGFSLSVRSEFDEESKKECEKLISDLRYMASCFKKDCNGVFPKKESEQFNARCDFLINQDPRLTCEQLGKNWKTVIDLKDGDLGKVFFQILKESSKCLNKDN